MREVRRGYEDLQQKHPSRWLNIVMGDQRGCRTRLVGQEGARAHVKALHCYPENMAKTSISTGLIQSDQHFEKISLAM